MTSTLLLRLAAPLQSWGMDAKFEIRRTNREPTKSGVIGLLAAALGRRRDEPVDDLSRLHFGVRVDQEGELLRDYHTASSPKKESERYVTERYYLSDAVFLVGLESADRDLLHSLEEALRFPVFPLFLGRRSCPPTLPLSLGIRETSLLEALKQEPWLASPWIQKKKYHGSVKLRIMTDANPEDNRAARQMDLPISYHPGHRQYTYRACKEHDSLSIKAATDFSTTMHDPMIELPD